MSSVIDVASGLNVVNEYDKRGIALRDLIATNIPGFIGRYYGFRFFGSDDISFPCFMVEPGKQIPSMITTGKYQLLISFQIYTYFVEDYPDALLTLSSFGLEALIELFSNNKFKQYAGYWTNSEIKGVEMTRPFIHGRPNRAKWTRVGLMEIDLWDFVIK